MSENPDVLSVPWLLGTSFLLLAMAMLEKALNLAGMSIPLIDVFPRQLLDWAIALAILEIAVTVRQILDRPA